MGETTQRLLAAESNTSSERLHCGIVMPIASMIEYPESHWIDVLAIIKEAVVASGFEANLVSYTEESSLIHTTIVQNLYDNPIVVCDVSGKNPNVMFELGLRLAFDKPTIIVKDDKTGYSFDTGSIEHLTYPRDLRFSKIVEFKERLAEKIKATLAKSAADPSYSTFLKHFKRVTIAKLEDKEVSEQDFILEELRGMRQQIDKLARPSSNPLRRHREELNSRSDRMTLRVEKLSNSALETLQKELSKIPEVKRMGITVREGKHTLMELAFDDSAPPGLTAHIRHLRDSLIDP